MKRHTSFKFPNQKYLPGSRKRHLKNVLPRELTAEKTTEFGSNSWEESKTYLFAIDLFNAGYWWEAHEILESLWKETERKSNVARFLQGLIQLSAALLKKSQSSEKGARGLKTKGITHLPVEKGTYLGVDLTLLVTEVEAFFAGTRSHPPVIRLKGVTFSQ